MMTKVRSCLVVDDSRVIRSVARKILEDLDFKVEEAEDGQRALDMCTNHMPDCVLLDWNMPVMSGIEFLRKLRGMNGCQNPIVIFCTTETDVESIREAMSAGANEYIMKPFDGGIIKSKLLQVGLIG